MSSNIISKIQQFQRLLQKSRSLVVLTGAGVSAESGVPTFRGHGSLWRQFRATDLATPSAFARSPSTVWQFYHYRRELVQTKKPNQAHLALVELEERFEKEGKRICVITQNVDGLHHQAGTKNLIEMHGNLFQVQCTKCGFIEENYASPICPALADEKYSTEIEINEKDLPRCPKCQSLLRPNVVWFGEEIPRATLQNIEKQLQFCDLFLLIGTSSVVYPAAGYAAELAGRHIPIVEINIETTPSTSIATYHFNSPAAQILPELLRSTNN